MTAGALTTPIPGSARDQRGQPRNDELSSNTTLQTQLGTSANQVECWASLRSAPTYALMRVTLVSVETQTIVEAMRAAPR